LCIYTRNILTEGVVLFYKYYYYYILVVLLLVVVLYCMHSRWEWKLYLRKISVLMHEFKRLKDVVRLLDLSYYIIILLMALYTEV
jgi:hypothetical protein